MRGLEGRRLRLVRIVDNPSSIDVFIERRVGRPCPDFRMRLTFECSRSKSWCWQFTAGSIRGDGSNGCETAPHDAIQRRLTADWFGKSGINTRVGQ